MEEIGGVTSRESEGIDLRRDYLYETAQALSEKYDNNPEVLECVNQELDNGTNPDHLLFALVNVSIAFDSAGGSTLTDFLREELAKRGSAGMSQM